MTALHGFLQGHSKHASHDSPVQQNRQTLRVGHHEVAQKVKEHQAAMSVVAGVNQTGVCHQRPHQGQDVVT